MIENISQYIITIHQITLLNELIRKANSKPASTLRTAEIDGYQGIKDELSEEISVFIDSMAPETFKKMLHEFLRHL